jgi:Uma2 family endonuclease
MTIHAAPSPMGTMTVDEFLSFLEFRPDEERWDLVDGVATMMAPPTYAHQRIASNLAVLLNARFEAAGIDLQAYPAAGVRIAGLDNFMPRPDVVARPGLAGDEIYAMDFRFVAEVLSPSNTRRLIDLKLNRYRASPDCLYVLVIDARRIWAELHGRDDGWTAKMLDDPERILALPGFGFRCQLGELYRNTTLAAAAR